MIRFPAFTALSLVLSGGLPLVAAAQAVPDAAPATSALKPGAVVVGRIEVRGNQRIEPQTIVSYLSIREGDAVDRYDLDQGMRSLFATGFFADVNLYMDGDRLVAKVVENPTVNRIAFEGNDHLKDEDIEKEVQLKARSIYTRPQIQNDLARILQLYRRSGYYGAKVEPKVITRAQNRVDVVYEIQEHDITRVNTIQFVGNKAFGSSTLEDVIRTTEECVYCFLSDNDKYDPDRVMFDQQLLRKFYTTQGYADFKVESAIAELSQEEGGGFYITFTIEEGPKYTFGKIDYDSSLPGVDVSRFKELIGTTSGDTYDAEAVENAIDAMTNELGDQGFAFVDIEPKTVRHQDSLTIDLTYHINEGPRVYVERINITGNMRTLDEVVRREFRVAEGDPFSTSKLQRSEQRLKNLGFFKDVKVSNERGSAPDRAVINVEVEEQSTGELSLGAGFSSTDGALADIGIRERNLLGRGQDLRLKATLATQRQQFDIGYTEPYFLGREMPTGFDLFRTTQDLRSESSFDRKSTGGRLRTGYALSEHLNHSLKYSYEQVDITNVDPVASRFIKDQEGVYVTSLVGHSLTYDRRNNAFDPSEGYYLQLSQDVAGLGGDSKFFRNELSASWYYSIYPQWVFMVGGSGGHVLGLDGDLKIQDRFFVGGRTLRGFNNAGIGPRDIVTRDALGGNIYYTGTTELQFPLGLDDFGITGATFVDVGSLYDVDETGPEVRDESSLRASAGVGIRWKSPFGPIRIDFAQAFMKEDYDETEMIRFDFGTRF